jgi:hypothetical protein
MPEQKKVNQPEEVQEAPESVIKRLADENAQLRQLAEKTINENSILRATIKALSQLI